MSSGGVAHKQLVIGLALSVIGVAGIIAGSIFLGLRDGHGRRHTYEDPPSSIEIVARPQRSGDEAGVDADDGELHDARRSDVPYRLLEGFWAMDETCLLTAYDMNVHCQFAVSYPRLEGDLTELDAINELLRQTAMETVHAYYEDPSDEAVKRVRKVANGPTGFVPDGADALLTSTVEYAVSYNSDQLLSVCFSDVCYLGSEAFGMGKLRTVNVNLQTGEAYVLDDVLQVTDSIAASFVNNLVLMTGEDDDENGRLADDECFALRLVGRKALTEALRGRGELAEQNRVSTCLFVDGNGQPNLGVTYWLSGDDGFVRGWWDVTITDEQLAAAHKPSELWELLGKA